MKPGDTVLTHDGETGVISHKAKPPYDWWVNISSRNVTMLIPYREKELNAYRKHSPDTK